MIISLDRNIIVRLQRARAYHSRIASTFENAIIIPHHTHHHGRLLKTRKFTFPIQLPTIQAFIKRLADSLLALGSQALKISLELLSPLWMIR
jgi:hypothetical protein